MSILAWIWSEPVVGLLALMSCVLYFGLSFLQAGTSTVSPYWIDRLASSLGKALLVFGILLGFRHFLSNHIRDFTDQRSEIQRHLREEVETKWGSWVLQHDLSVEQYIENDILTEFAGDSGTTLYKTITEHETVSYNHIDKFRGDIDLTLSDLDLRVAGEEGLFNTFFVDTRLEYFVSNSTDQTTIADFSFRVPSNAPLIQDFSILYDGIDIAHQVEFSDTNISWSKNMLSNEQAHIEIEYSARGHNSFQFSISEQRRIYDFDLRIDFFGGDVIYLEVSPWSDALKPSASPPPNRHWQWEIDDVLTSADLRIAYAQPEIPYSPYYNVNQVITRVPNAYVLLFTLLVLTSIIRGSVLSLFDVLLLSGSLLALLLGIMMSFDIFRLEFSLLLGAITFALLVVPWLLRQQSILLRILYLVLSLLSAFGYPLIGLLPLDIVQKNMVATGIFAGIILYLFVLTMFTRIYSRNIMAS